jgi:hypothetical protein
MKSSTGKETYITERLQQQNLNPKTWGRLNKLIGIGQIYYST